MAGLSSLVLVLMLLLVFFVDWYVGDVDRVVVVGWVGCRVGGCVGVVIAGVCLLCCCC